MFISRSITNLILKKDFFTCLQTKHLNHETKLEKASFRKRYEGKYIDFFHIFLKTLQEALEKPLNYHNLYYLCTHGTSSLMYCKLLSKIYGKKANASADQIPSSFLKAVFNKIYLVHS